MSAIQDNNACYAEIDCARDEDRRNRDRDEIAVVDVELVFTLKVSV